MNSIEANEMTVVQLRKLAASLGIKNVSRLQKAQLAVAVARASSAQEAEQIKAEKAKADADAKRREEGAAAAKAAAAAQAAAEEKARTEQMAWKAAKTTRTVKGSVKTAKQAAQEQADAKPVFEETVRKPLTAEQRAASEAAIAAVRKAAGVVDAPVEEAPAKKAKKAKAPADTRAMARGELVATRKSEKAAAKAAAAAAKAAKAPKRKICSAEGCGRPQDLSINGPELCTEHLEEANWENTHNDNSHDLIASKKVAHADFGRMTAKEYREWIKSEKELMEKCWTCHPELNKAVLTLPHTSGTSRAGMVMSVPVRGTGAEKAAVVVATLEAKGISSSFKAFPKQGTVRLDAQVGDGTMTITWSTEGKFYYEFSGINGRKVRNVSAALKAVGAA